jgi:xylan 1,4-beta-xylosidase
MPTLTHTDPDPRACAAARSGPTSAALAALLLLGACTADDRLRADTGSSARASGALVAATPVPIAVDWLAPSGQQATPLHFGLNAFKGLDPWIAGSPGNATYKQNVAYMRPGLLRYHNMGMMGDSSGGGSGWVVSPTTADYRWDRAKIAKALEGAYTFGPTRMMDIANWPAFLDDGTGKLRPDAYDAYAAFCADLVRAINVELGAGIVYWEVGNEKDPAYAADIGALGEIHKRAAIAMKAVDPNIKVGGPGLLNPYKTQLVRGFLAVAADHLDFFTYHSYSTGDHGSSTKGLLDNAAGLGWVTSASIKPLLEWYSDRPIETFHNEWAISWNPPDARMTNVVGAIYDALAMISLTEAGVTGSAAWNESDGRQGKLSDVWGKYELRPAAHVYHLFNEHLSGVVVGATTGDRARVVPFATRAGARPALVLVNRDPAAAQIAALTLAGLASGAGEDGTWAVHQVTAQGLTTSSTTGAALTAAAGLELPPYSVTVLVGGAGVALSPLPPPPPPVPPTPEVVIARAATPPTIDGVVDPRWEQVAPLPLGNVVQGPADVPAVDLAGSFRALWDDEHLYLLVDVQDDARIKDSANSWDDDGVEIFVDADNGKTRSYGRNDFQYAFRWGSPTPIEAKRGATDGVTLAQVDTATGYRMEIAIPFATIRGKPAAGGFIGLEVHVNDDDDGGGRDGKRAWFGTVDNAWQTPAAFADAELGAAAQVATGLRGTYFTNRSMTTVAVERVDPTLDFDWGTGSPAIGVPMNDFAARWTGKLVPLATGPLTLTTSSDDGVRVRVGGQVVIDAWNDHSRRDDDGTVDVVAGQAYDLVVEYYERWGQAALSLSWSWPGQARAIVPASQLRPE